jgi:hypothetical protein
MRLVYQFNPGWGAAARLEPKASNDLEFLATRSETGLDLLRQYSRQQVQGFRGELLLFKLFTFRMMCRLIHTLE